MRRRSKMNRPNRWTLLLVVLASLMASVVVFAGPAAADRCNDTDRIDLSLTYDSTSSRLHTFTVGNAGPDCAHDVVVTFSLQPASAAFKRVVSASPNSWRCSGSPGGGGGTCRLSAAIPAPPSSSSSASVTIELTGAATGLNAEVGSEKLTEAHPSDNEVWGSHDTSFSSAEFDASSNQNVKVSRPEPATIGINQVQEGAGLAAPAPPCGTAANPCVTVRQVEVDTPDVGGPFPQNRIEIEITRSLELLNADQANLFLLAAAGQLNVYRYVDFDGGTDEWRELPFCDPVTGDTSTGDTSDHAVGCVKEFSASPNVNQPTVGVLRIVLHTQHNGHYR
jgi:hypothetical protein